ncbi:MAG: pyridoxamine 5'-phosphate oxidase [Longispora sp.]|nr:pyridoxamine 5'-phosphate oxidase [Longispora sp. (in: high G+C Gram-positive bacteria)]
MCVTKDTSGELAALRREYGNLPLDETGLAADWLAQFTAWMEDVRRADFDEANAMVLATATPDGRPSTRSVLLKAYDSNGFVFFTNYDSRKGRELAANPRASLLFPWYPLHRQVVVCGTAEGLPRARTEEYFASRPRGARLGAWASPQSQVITGRDELEAAWRKAERRWADEIPVPDNWGGYRVRPETVEFWQGRNNRLHDRLRFRRSDEKWIIERLAP